MWSLLTHDEAYALTLSTFAGLSTSLGGGIAVMQRPGPKLLAFLLGIAIGVMASLSIVELLIRNALEHGWLPVTCSAGAGALVYCVISPFIPEFDDLGKDEDAKDDGAALELMEEESGAKADGESPRATSAPGSRQRLTSATSGTLATTQSAPQTATSHAPQPKAGPPKGELLRLGILMAITMTIHNMPEGFAVAFAANTALGPLMAIAIAVHNIPEGIIVAAPIYAATGSRWRALGVATLSGLSEPLGALIALIALRPYLTPARLQYLLAFTGGIMTAVCVVELWPEGRKCRAPVALAQGCVLGAVVMLWTLWIGA